MVPSTTPRKTDYATRSSTNHAFLENNEPKPDSIDQLPPLDINTPPSHAQDTAVPFPISMETPKPSLLLPPASTTAPSSPTTSQTTTTTTTFLASLIAHYKSNSDAITPHRFFQLCKDYNDGKLDEKDFYVAVYRLLFATHAANLLPGFRAFLPAGWRDVELKWLDQAIEEDVRSEMMASRGRVGGLVGLMERICDGDVASEAGTVGFGAEVVGKQARLSMPKDNGSAEVVTSPEPTKRKKKPPANGFRASDVPPSLALLQRLTDKYEAANKSSPPKKGYEGAKATSPKMITTSGKGTSPTSTKAQYQFSSKRKSAPAVSGTSSPVKYHPSTPASDPAPVTTTTAFTSTSLPSASIIRHLGPIYPSTRAILSRASKPYIHSLCGQHFGHPQEVQRHHNGQGGRPGCWEKSGKPTGEEGKWDAHASCKVKLADLEYVKVREGWVVVSWGGVVAEGVREGMEGRDGEFEGAGAGAGGLRGGSLGRGGKGEVGETSDWIEEDAEGANDDDDDDDQSCDEVIGEEDDEDFVQGPVLKAKRQKIVKVEDDENFALEESAAARAVVFGLRARK